jgi:hypothetical protein
MTDLIDTVDTPTPTDVNPGISVLANIPLQPNGQYTLMASANLKFNVDLVSGYCYLVAATLLTGPVGPAVRFGPVPAGQWVPAQAIGAIVVTSFGNSVSLNCALDPGPGHLGTIGSVSDAAIIATAVSSYTAQ